MSSRVKQCLRLAQVRSVQHGIALAAVQQAFRRVAALEGSASRIDQLRHSFATSCGPSSGAGLARSGEMAMRLDLARKDLGLSIDRARHQAAASDEIRLDARRKQESMKKLSDRAALEASAAAALREEATRPRLRRKTAGERS